MIKLILSLSVYTRYYGYKWFKDEPRHYAFVDALVNYETVINRPHRLDAKLNLGEI